MARGYSDKYSGTEFTGDTWPNTLPAKRKGDRLTANERLRLIKRTGQDQDPTAAPDDRAWIGLESSPRSVIDQLD